jgi:TFIIF-interacting CTD phosphatase-like protein
MTQQKVNVLLDLDQTVISAEGDDEYDHGKSKDKATKFKFHDMDGYYIVFERPGLQPFLDWLFKNYNVSVWTAASKDYALFIVDKILLGGHPERKLDWIFFSYHCDISKKLKNGTKDLSTIWDLYKIVGFDQNNTVIIDDYDEVYKTQPNNCIIAQPFEFNDDKSDKDDYLLRLQSTMPKMENKFPAHKINQEMNSL